MLAWEGVSVGESTASGLGLAALKLAMASETCSATSSFENPRSVTSSFLELASKSEVRAFQAATSVSFPSTALTLA